MERTKMKIADKIINERKKMGWSQEDLAERLSVSRQSVSKWEGAQAVPDLQRIIDMATLFGVSTDYLLRDEIEPEQQSEIYEFSQSDKVPPLKKVSVEIANEYTELIQKDTPLMIASTIAFMLCPVPLIFLAGLSEEPRFGVSETMAVCIGLLALFIMAAIGAAIRIMISTKENSFEYIYEGRFETEYGVTSIIEEKKKKNEEKFLILKILAIILFCICPLPLLIMGVYGAADYILVAMVCLILIISAIGVAFYFIKGRVNHAYENLLNENRVEEIKEEKRSKKIKRAVSTAYWCTITAVFLAFGFIFGRWEFAGIIFPIAGVLFAAVMAILKAAIKD